MNVARANLPRYSITLSTVAMHPRLTPTAVECDALRGVRYSPMDTRNYFWLIAFVRVDVITRSQHQHAAAFLSILYRYSEGGHWSGPRLTVVNVHSDVTPRLSTNGPRWYTGSLATGCWWLQLIINYMSSPILQRFVSRFYSSILSIITCEWIDTDTVHW